MAEVNETRKRKMQYGARLQALIAEYRNVLIVGVDHVGSRQMQQVRLALRGRAILLMGKNTIIRKVCQDLYDSGNKKIGSLLPLIKGNVGFVFTNSDLQEIRDVIVSNKVPAAARTGVVAPDDVFIPAGPTGLDPGQTAFFQALNIPTKIARGAIEIVNRCHLIKMGERVSASAVALLGKLNVRPFFFGITVAKVYSDGSVFGVHILDLTEDVLLGRFFMGVRAVAALSLELGYPTMASIRHSFINGFKNLLCVSLATDYTFEESKVFKEYLENPDAFAAAAPAAAAGDAPAAKKDDESSSDDDSDDDGSGGMDLFDM